ncbi:MAG: TonB family protein [Pseudomonadota bacterium]
MRHSALILIGLLLLTPARASDVDTFKAAWSAYDAAMQTDDTQQRVDAARAVVDAGKVIFEESDERLTTITHNYGIALANHGDKEQAAKAYKEALRLGEIAFGKQSGKLIVILSDLADSKAEVYSPAAQMKHYRRALKIAEAEFGKQSIEYADLAFRRSHNVYTMSRSTAAQKDMKVAREIYASLPEPRTQNVALSDYFLGRMEFSAYNYRRSSEHLELALDGFSGPDDSSQKQALRLMTRALLVQTYESRGLSEDATEHCIAIGRDTQFSPDQDYAPIFRIAPVYPASMLSAGKMGYVDLEFTVTESGFVEDVTIINRVVDGKPKERRSDFDKAALDAVQKFRYAPRFVDGKAVASSGVQTRISFKIES